MKNITTIKKITVDRKYIIGSCRGRKVSNNNALLLFLLLFALTTCLVSPGIRINKQESSSMVHVGVTSAKIGSFTRD